MKAMIVIPALLMLLYSAGMGQQPGEGWKIRPTLAFVKLLPGDEIHVASTTYPTTYRYAGTGLSFLVRATHADVNGIALTFGSGVNWYYRPDENFMRTSASGIGAVVGGKDFNTFPLSVGLQIFIPQRDPDALMGFVGGDVAVHFVDGDVPFGEQARFGYDLIGGFAVKMFEVGFRYSTFSDISNLAVQFGFRLNSFAL
jgi:hypothetical protein